MKLLRILLIAIILTASLSATVMPAYAANVPPSVSVKPATVDPGGNISVIVSTGENSAMYSVSVTNGTGNVAAETYYTGSSKTFTCVAGKTGTVTIKVSGTYTNPDANYEELTFSKTVYVTIKEEEPEPVVTTPTTPSTPTTPTVTAPVKSSVSTLSSLSVLDHDLNVDFSSGTKTYNVDVDSDVESITINAKATDSDASVSGTGEKTVAEGDNKYEVVCTAENGSKSTYTINVHRRLEPTVFVAFGGATLGVVRDFKNVSIPDDYTEETITVDNQEISSYYAKNIGRDVVYLENEDGDESWYVAADNAITTEISAATLFGLNGYIIAIPEEKQDIDGCTLATVAIDDREVPGWTFDENQFSEYRLIYYMDEAGNENIYQYELSQNTLQLWEGTSISNEQYSAMMAEVDDLNSSLQVYTYSTYGLAGALGIGSLAVLIKSIRARRLKKQTVQTN